MVTDSTKRINLLLVIVLIASGGIVYRLFSLTVLQHSNYVKYAQKQYENSLSQLENRGNIYFLGGEKNGYLAATNQSFTYVYSDNTQVGDPSGTAKTLADILGEESGRIADLLSHKNKEYVVLAEKISDEQAKKIKEEKFEGVSIGSATERFYPQGETASYVLGFVGFEGYRRVGQYGVESTYNRVLSGLEDSNEWFGNTAYSKVAGFFKSAVGGDNKEKLNETEKEEQSNNSDIVLTIDKDIQDFVESKLNSLLEKWQSPSGLAIVQNPNTGAILALVASPGYDPNEYDKFNLSEFVNPVTQKLFEPGSSFKPITMAGALDKGVVEPNTTYNDTGTVTESGFTIKNFDERSHGVQTMRQVLEKSLNTGTIFAQGKLGNDDFLNYAVAFGFGQKTGIDMPGEIIGNISNLYTGRKINFMTASFGQGIAVTPIQLINAYSAMANGGKLMKPYIVEEIINSDGTRIVTEPEILGQPIKEKTSLAIKSMLTGAVDNGFDKARVSGYDVAGKTGTAQISEDGEYGEDFIHSFVGFAPSYNPMFVVLLKIDRPKGEEFASNTLSPAFADIMKFLFNYYGVPPTR
ncbi:MAG: hypothetical protein COV29_01960 [Candidatus Yanofskybacteria bacterium CG10_big_fil_rev_8_21_14_0_10_36_16]|uniref:Penicillin-binding protein transpeptidase domain-containing protein n=1 Tax=Candidatus Yanofskybacteria bacterium CG10_big_fil_rev_8_21_14_0_10_36_16 TaxID=1975096 RepID=A0A2J0QA96_9BACT|nr:MAG: hypothetical protein COV29_01960 [Candidatus Yanofskybacteria bacterium CG10_big_fil_rev_8_21_14_0_10_36_16]